MKFRVTFGCATALACLLTTSDTRASVILDWNEQLLEAIRISGQSVFMPPDATRTAALVHTAMFNATNLATGKQYQNYQLDHAAVADASAEAAAAQAAYDVLVGRFAPTSSFATLSPLFDAQLAASLGAISDGAAKSNGIALGSQMATHILDLRATDGATTVVPYTPGQGDTGIFSDPNAIENGEWRPTGSGDALSPNWPTVTPWSMISGDQFRPGGPPDQASLEYQEAYEEVYKFGELNSVDRTADQTEIALFWADGPGTATPGGHWLSLAASLLSTQFDLVLIDESRLLALMSIALADAAIVSWDAKYAFHDWRPITGIHEGDTDGNPNTVGDPSWQPLLETPPFPDYTSGHSTFSGAAAMIMAQFFGDDALDFCTESDGLPGVMRCFTHFSEVAEEAGLSRIYGGIHWHFSKSDGVEAGGELGQFVFLTQLRPVPEPATLGLAALGLIGLAALRRKAT